MELKIFICELYVILVKSLLGVFGSRAGSIQWCW